MQQHKRYLLDFNLSQILDLLDLRDTARHLVAKPLTLNRTFTITSSLRDKSNRGIYIIALQFSLTNSLNDVAILTYNQSTLINSANGHILIEFYLGFNRDQFSK